MTRSKTSLDERQSAVGVGVGGTSRLGTTPTIHRFTPIPLPFDACPLSLDGNLIIQRANND